MILLITFLQDEELQGVEPPSASEPGAEGTSAGDDEHEAVFTDALVYGSAFHPLMHGGIAVWRLWDTANWQDILFIVLVSVIACRITATIVRKMFPTRTVRHSFSVFWRYFLISVSTILIQYTAIIIYLAYKVGWRL